MCLFAVKWVLVAGLVDAVMLAAQVGRQCSKMGHKRLTCGFACGVRARDLLMDVGERAERFRFLVRDPAELAFRRIVVLIPTSG